MKPEDIAKVPEGDNAFTWRCEANQRRNMADVLHWYRNARSYRGAALATYAAATRAAERAAKRHGRWGWIVVMDADETVVDNSDYFRELEACGIGFTPATWCDWTREATARPIAGAAAFTRRVHELGGFVAIVTNRSTAMDEPTKRNLERAGIHFDAFRGRAKDADKAPRWTEVAEELAPVARKAGRRGAPPRVAIWIGDQVTDLAVFDAKGAIAGSMNEADPLDEPKAGFGESQFVLPNPIYGTWESKARE